MRNVPRFGRDLSRFWDTADPLLGEPINELEEGSARDGFTADFHPQWLVVKKLSSVPMAFESDFHM